MAFELDKENRVIAGVCGGLAKDLNIEPIVPRLAFIFMTLFVGGGILLYLILWILMALSKKQT
jgi:phage shock protein C